MDNYKETLIELETAAHRAYSRGIQTGSGGNLSARIRGQALMLLKSSGGSFADCSSNGNGFVLTDLYGNVSKEMTEKPTRESFMHGFLYRLNQDIGGVVHCHSPWAISWSFTRKSLPMITQHLKLKFGCVIPVIDIPSPMVKPEHAPEIEALFTINPGLPAFILLGHGIVAVGRDVLTAEHNAELVEETAQIAIIQTICSKLGVLD